MPAQAQQPAAPAAAPVKLGIVSFLTGPAASPFGIPGRNGAEIVIEDAPRGVVYDVRTGKRLGSAAQLTTVLRPGETYRSTTVYRFQTDAA